MRFRGYLHEFNRVLISKLFNFIENVNRTKESEGKIPGELTADIRMQRGKYF